MSKNKYEMEIDFRIKEIKSRMKECIEEYKKETDLLHTNYVEFGIVPLDFQLTPHRNLLNNFQFWAHRLSSLEEIRHTIKIKEQRVRSDRKKKQKELLVK